MTIVYVECDTCSWATSVSEFKVDLKEANHQDETGHSVFTETYFGDDDE